MDPDNAQIAAKIKLETAEMQLELEFSDARVVTSTAAHVVVALDNPAGDRLVATLPKALLGRLVGLGDLLGG